MFFFGQPAIRKQIVLKLLLTSEKKQGKPSSSDTISCYGKWSHLCILNIHFLGSTILYSAVYGMKNNKINEEIKKTKQGVGEMSRYHVLWLYDIL